jgi:hypothetical protein
VEHVWDLSPILCCGEHTDSNDVPVVAVSLRKNSAEPLHVPVSKAALQANTPQACTTNQHDDCVPTTSDLLRLRQLSGASVEGHCSTGSFLPADILFGELPGQPL